jgi:Fis family transcriptional regulator
MNTLSRDLSHLVATMQSDRIPLSDAVTAFKKEWLELELWRNKGNYCRTARNMGTHRNTLTRAVKELGIDVTTIRKASGREREASRMTGAA